MFEVITPGKLILFGEHAVVYDKLGIATTIGKYSKFSISPANDNNVFIKSVNLGIESKKNETEITNIVNYIEKLRDKGKIDKIKDIAKNDKLLPSFFVIGKIIKEYGFTPVSIEIFSEVPKNLGSSASVFNGIVKGLSEFLKIDIDKEKTAYFANEGDKIVHGTPSGIDAYTIAYGGWNSYRKSEGINKLNINFEVPIIVVNSGEPAKTGETVAYVRNQIKEKPEFVNSILRKLDEIANKGLNALKSEDMKSVGLLMFEYYKELKKLNISTKKLDEIANIAKENKALGAKPTGGWGGGSCIVLAEDTKQMNELINIYKKNNYIAFASKLGIDNLTMR